MLKTETPSGWPKKKPDRYDLTRRRDERRVRARSRSPELAPIPPQQDYEHWDRLYRAQGLIDEEPRNRSRALSYMDEDFVPRSRAVSYMDEDFVPRSRAVSYMDEAFVAPSRALSYMDEDFVPRSRAPSYMDGGFVPPSRALSYMDGGFIPPSRALSYMDEDFVPRSRAPSYMDGGFVPPSRALSYMDGGVVSPIYVPPADGVSAYSPATVSHSARTAMPSWAGPGYGSGYHTSRVLSSRYGPSVTASNTYFPGPSYFTTGPGAMPPLYV